MSSFYPFKRSSHLLASSALGVAALAVIVALPASAQTSVPSVPSPSASPVVPVDSGISPSATPILPEPTPSPSPGVLTPSRTVIPRADVPAANYREDTYVLGSGDQIGIDIFDVPEFSGDRGRYTVLIDGSVNLPWIGRVPVQGLTLEQAASIFTRKYSPFIRNPLITVNLLTARTLRITVVGEVKRPGSYIVSPEGATNQPLVIGTGVAGAGTGAANQWPTVTQAIQSAGGITQLADLRQVEIHRPQPDGSEQVIDVNLWELLRSGDIRQDVAIRDRDTLIIPTAPSIGSDEAILLGSASFAPETITVNVVGEVGAPGTIELPPNVPLNQAIMRAGGFDKRRARSSRVELVRLNSNGTAVQRTIPVDMAAGINEESNPALRDNDTIIVGRSGLTSFTDTLGQALDPVGRVIGVFDVFNLFGTRN